MGSLVLIIGILLLVLPKWFMTIVGVLAVAFGLFAIIYPDKSAAIVNKFESHQGGDSQE